jgi:hypothetical protein
VPKKSHSGACENMSKLDILNNFVSCKKRRIKLKNINKMMGEKRGDESFTAMCH